VKTLLFTVWRTVRTLQFIVCVNCKNAAAYIAELQKLTLMLRQEMKTQSYSVLCSSPQTDYPIYQYLKISICFKETVKQGAIHG
jgi:hypothetical protein